MNKIDWSPSPGRLRVFGWTILAGFGLIGGLLWKAGHAPAAQSLWTVAGLTGLLALIHPPASLPFYRAWMGLGFVMGAVMSRVVLALIFFLVITPLGLFFRLKGRDALRLRRGKGSYWTDHPALDDKTDSTHLF